MNGTTEPLASHFVTVDYVASLLHADRRTVCNWLTSGRLPGTRPGGTRWLIAREDLAAFIQAASNRPPAPDRQLHVLPLENVTEQQDGGAETQPPALSPLTNRKKNGRKS